MPTLRTVEKKGQKPFTDTLLRTVEKKGQKPFTDTGSKSKVCLVLTGACLVHCLHVQHTAPAQVKVIQAYSGLREAGFQVVQRLTRRDGSIGRGDFDDVAQSRSVGCLLRDSL